jgi:hypothetical protein
MKSVNLKHLRAFLTFDLPLDRRHIGATFNTTPNQLKAVHPEWSLQATRQKLSAGIGFGMF